MDKLNLNKWKDFRLTLLAEQAKDAAEKKEVKADKEKATHIKVSKNKENPNIKVYKDEEVDEAKPTIGDARSATRPTLATTSGVAEPFHRSNQIPAGCPSSDNRPSTRTRSLSTRPHAGWRDARLAFQAALASATTTRQTRKTHPAGGHP